MSWVLHALEPAPLLFPSSKWTKMFSALAVRLAVGGSSIYGTCMWVDNALGGKPRSCRDDCIVHLPLGLTLAHADDGGAIKKSAQGPGPAPVGASYSSTVMSEQKAINEIKASGNTPSTLGTCGKQLPIDAASLKPYEGRWLVIFRSPGSMEQFFDLFTVSPWLRWVAKHVPGYQLKVDEKQGVAHLSILSPIPLVKLTETYRLDGEESTSRRRDFRPGVQRGRMELDQGCLRFHLHWGDPLKGSAMDVFRLTSSDTMVMASEARLQGGAEQAAVITQQGEGEGGERKGMGEGGRVPGQRVNAPLSATFRCLCRRETPVGSK